MALERSLLALGPLRRWRPGEVVRLQLVTMPTATEHASLQAAARTIYIAATGTAPGDPIAIASAHATLTRQRQRPIGPAP